MLIQRAYKTELDPNNKQRTVLLKHADTARFAYNWGLARRKEEYKNTGHSSNAFEQHKQLNALKKIDFSWMYEVSKCAPQEALRDLGKAYKNFFEGRTAFPKFKSRKERIGSFRLTGAIRVSKDAIQLPRLGLIRIKEQDYLPTNLHILSATVSERAGRWFVSVLVEKEIPVPINPGEIAGVDLGIKSFATVSDGAVFKNTKALSRYERRLKREQRAISRKKKGGNNRKKAVRKLQTAHARISNIRKDVIHKATTWLAKTKSVVVVEDLNASRNLEKLAVSCTESINACGEESSDQFGETLPMNQELNARGING